MFFNLHCNIYIIVDLFDFNEYQLNCRDCGKLFFFVIHGLNLSFFLNYDIPFLASLKFCAETLHIIVMWSTIELLIFVLLILPLLLLKAGSCPNLLNWSSYNKHCYIVVDGSGNQAKTWREAKKWCQNYGADLVSIGTMLEQLFVQSQAANTSSATLWTGFSEIDYDFGYRLVH